jgi:hypothetical protein
VHEHSAVLPAFSNELGGCREVSDDLGLRGIGHLNYFVGKVFGKHGLQIGSHLEDVRDVGLLEGEEVLGCLEIAKPETVLYFVH